MKKVLFIASLFIACSACAKNDSLRTVKIPGRFVNHPAVAPRIVYANKKIIFYGNSITAQASYKYPTLLCARLGAIENNYAVSGSFLEHGPYYNLYDIMSTIPVKNDSIALIVINYGINDAGWNGVAGYSLSKFTSSYDSLLTLLTTVKNYLPKQILIISVHWVYNPNAYSPPLTEAATINYLNAEKSIAVKYGTQYAEPFYSIKDHSEYFVADGLHLNSTGQQVIADLIFNGLEY